MARCSSCGAAYLAEFPDAESLSRYYSENYTLTTGDHLENERRRLFRSTEQLELVATLMKYVSPPARLLDIGCDKGYFIDSARRFGYSTLGVEPSATSRAYCDSVALDVCKSISEVKEKFDAVVMWHSLEHFPEPVSAVREIRGIMKTGAVIMVRVPDFDCIWRKIFGKRWIWFQPDNHYFHYNIRSLVTLFSREGFEIIKISGNRPNNRITRKMFGVSNKILLRLFGSRISLKKRIGRIYEDVTGREIFMIARLK